MERQQYLYLIIETYLATKNPIASEPAEPMFDLQTSLFRQILIRKQKVAEREDFITKEEFFLQCELALDHLKEFVCAKTFFELQNLNQNIKSLQTYFFERDGSIHDLSDDVIEENKKRIQAKIDDFDEQLFLVDLSDLRCGTVGKLCSYDIEFIEEIVKNIDTEIEQLQKPETKLSKTNEIQLFFETLDQFNQFEKIKKIYDFTDKLEPYLLKSFIDTYVDYVDCLSFNPFEDDDLEAPTFTVPFNGSEIVFNLNKVTNLVMLTHYGFIKLLETFIKGIEQPQQPEPEPLDLSDSKITDKIAYLYESGIIDFLHKKDGKPHNVNSIASLLSGITGIKPNTIQSAINPFINTLSTSKGTPAQSTLNRAKAKIIDLGF